MWHLKKITREVKNAMLGPFIQTYIGLFVHFKTKGCLCVV
jgi:hypothetical protein